MCGIDFLHGGHQYSKHSIINGYPAFNSDTLLIGVNFAIKS